MTSTSPYFVHQRAVVDNRNFSRSRLSRTGRFDERSSSMSFVARRAGNEMSRSYGNRLCTLQSPASGGALFDTLTSCQDNSPCAYSYQCPAVYNALDPYASVEVANALGQHDKANVGCFACENGKAKFMPSATGHYSVGFSGLKCQGILPVLTLKNVKVPDGNYGNNSTISGYGLVKLGSVVAGTSWMSVDTSYFISLDEVNGAGGDDAIVASLIVVDETLFSNQPLTSSSPFALLLEPKTVVAGSVFDTDSSIAAQSQKPGVVVIYRGSGPQEVSLRVTNVPVTLNQELTVYAYLGFATDDWYTLSVADHGTQPGFIFNSDRYSYYCPPVQGAVAVRRNDTSDGRMLPNLVACYGCGGQDCTFHVNSTGFYGYDVNCGGACTGRSLDKVVFSNVKPVGALNYGSNVGFDYMGLVSLGSFVAVGNKMDVIGASYYVALSIGSGDDRLMPTLLVVNTNSLVLGNPFYEPLPNFKVYSKDQVFNTINSASVAGFEFTTNLVGDTTSKTNNNSSITVLTRGKNTTVSFNGTFEVKEQTMYTVYAVLGIATNDGITINNVTGTVRFHY